MLGRAEWCVCAALGVRTGKGPGSQHENAAWVRPKRGGLLGFTSKWRRAGGLSPVLPFSGAPVSGPKSDAGHSTTVA